MNYSVIGQDKGLKDITKTALALEGGVRLVWHNSTPIDLDDYFELGNYYCRSKTDANPDRIYNMPEGCRDGFLMKTENASGDATQNPLILWRLQTIEMWDGSAIYKRAGKITTNAQGAVTAKEWEPWKRLLVKKPLPEDQQSEFNRKWLFGDIGGDAGNQFIDWSRDLINPAYLGGGTLCITDVHVSSNFATLCEWIKQNKANITAVVNCGDNVANTYTSSGVSPWLMGDYDTGVKKIMNSGIPYICAVGNHDACNASIDDLEPMLRPINNYFSSNTIEAGIYTFDGGGFVTADADQTAALKARHLGYLYVILNKQTGYYQPYLVLNCYDSDKADTSALLRDESEEAHWFAYISKVQAKLLLQDCFAFYESINNKSKILPLITVTHKPMTDNSDNAFMNIAITENGLQKRFNYTAGTGEQAVAPYAHRFQQGGGNDIHYEKENLAAGLTYLGMICGELGLESSSDVVTFGTAIADAPSGICSAWTITKGEMEPSDGYLAWDLYKKNGVNICGHFHLDYFFINSTGGSYVGKGYPSAHYADVVLSSAILAPSNNKWARMHYTDIIFDDFYSYDEILFTMFGYTAEGYDTGTGALNKTVDFVLERYGRRMTLGGVDRSTQYLGYSAAELDAE